MQSYKTYLTIGATMVIAIGAGHAVQTSGRSTLRQHVAAPATVPATAPSTNLAFARRGFSFDSVTPLAAPSDIGAMLQNAAYSVTLPEFPNVSPHLGGQDSDPKILADRLAKLERGYPAPEYNAQELNQYGLPCTIDLKAVPAPGGMVHLILNTPCRPDSRVEISHERLVFTAQTTNTGALSLSVPALAVRATFIAQFEDNKMLVATTAVPEAANYERVALQWRGDTGMHLHAYEFGAKFGSSGHVWAQAPREPASADKGGFMTALGDATVLPPRMAEVYSFPRGDLPASGVVRLNVETEITPQNCGREIAGETLQPGAEGGIQAVEISVSVPACDAVGEFLVLKNILRDLKIAGN